MRPPGSPRARSVSGSGATPWSAVNAISVCCSPTTLSTLREQPADRAVGADRDVPDLRRIGTEGVADGVVRREADGEQIGGVARAELLAGQQLGREVEQQLVAERAAVDAS